MSEQHTPGPWIFVPASVSGAFSSGDDNDMGGFKSADGEFVCHFGDDTMYYPSAGTPPNEADARLIAAAPKLLAALAGFVAVDASFGSARIETLREMAASGSESSLLAKVVLAAREALAEVTGGAP